MTIKRRLQLTAVAAILFVLGTASSLLWFSHQVEDGIKLTEITARMVHDAFMMRVLMKDFLVQGNSGLSGQWEKYNNRLGQLLKDDMIPESTARELLEDLQKSYQAVNHLYPRLLEMRVWIGDKEQPQEQKGKELLIGLMYFELEQLVNAANDLSQATHLVTLHRRLFVQKFIVAAGVLLVVFILINVYLIRKSLVRPLRALSIGAERIGVGNFDYIPETKSDHEVEKVGRAFNTMVERLGKRETALVQAKEEWERTFDAVPDLILVLDKEHRIVRANQATADILGIPLEQIVGQPCFRLVHGLESPIVSCPHSLLLADGKEHFAEVFEKRVNRTFQVSVSPLRDADGATWGSVHVARDITARKNAEQALRESEQRFRLFMNNSPTVAWMKDEQGRHAYVSKTFETRFGIRAEDWIGKTDFEVWPKEVAEEFRKNDQAVLSSGERIVVTEEIMSPNGDRSNWWNFKFLFVDDLNRRYVGGIGVDITQRKQMEEALKAKLRLKEYGAAHSIDELLQKTVDEAQGLTDSRIGFFHLLEADQKTLSLQAWSTNTLNTACTAKAKGAHYSIDDAGVWVDCVRQRRAIIHNDYGSLPHRKGTPEGHAPIVRELVVPIFQGEAIVAILGVGNKPFEYTDTDVDVVANVAATAWSTVALKRAEEALKASEEQYRVIVQEANDLVYTTDANGTLTFVNPSVLRITGYAQEEVAGRHYSEFIHPEYKKEFDRFYGIQFVKKIPETYYEFPFLSKGGETVWIGQNAQLLMDGDSIVGFQAIARDITDRRKAEDALKKAHDELDKRVRERTSELALVNAQLRESEARFRAIFEAAEDCVFVQDQEFRFTHVNPAMQKLLGKPASEVLGLTDEVLFGKEAALHTREVGSRVLLGQSVEEEHTHLIRGVPLTFHEIRVPLQDRSGNIVGLCGIARDISGLRALRAPTQPIACGLYPSPVMRHTLERALLAAETDSIVLLTGESGSGKDYLAQHIHEHSKRANGPFFTVNCAAVPHDLAESELFGHERGAFSGAVSRKRGLLELAEGGTLLLNEIGELPLPLQTKLLTFLDSKRFTRVGGEKTIAVDTRLIAATNRELEKDVQAGRFRKDLFYRINVVSITVPPLRERRDDIPVLVEEILAQLAKDMLLTHVPLFESSALSALAQYDWPGNVRELRNVLERSLMLCRGDSLQLDLDNNNNDLLSEPFWVATFPPEKPLNDMAHDLKRSLILEALERSKGKKTDAARLLKISRDALKRHMITLGLSGPDRPQVAGRGSD